MPPTLAGRVRAGARAIAAALERPRPKRCARPSLPPYTPPFISPRVPAYYALILRSLTVLEGLALQADRK
jgi:hypothetical protein